MYMYISIDYLKSNINAGLDYNHESQSQDLMKPWICIVRSAFNEAMAMINMKSFCLNYELIVYTVIFGINPERRV